MAEVLWGREAELATLRGLLDPLPGHGGALILRGEAGVGKSSLLAAAAAQAAARDLRVVTAVGVQAECQVPFAGLQTLLSRFDASDLVGAVESRDNHPFQVALAVLEMLTAQAADRPLLLVIEDAQWLDRPSWEVLTFVGRRLGADPIVLLVAMRDGEETDARLAGLALPELRVEPLTEPDAAALLDDRTPGLARDLRARVLAEAEGNPLGLVELGVAAARFGESALLPAWLPLTTRLERTFGVLVSELPALTRSLLLVAALDDGDALHEVLAAGSLVESAPAGIEDVEPAISARLLEVDHTFRVRFRHPLVRSSVHQAASVSQRRRVYAALAEVLPDRDRKVWHRAAATIGVDEEVADDLVAAGERARRRGATATAVTAWERAAQLTGDPSRRAGRLLWAAEAAAELGEHKTFERLVRSVAEQDLPPAERARLSWIREALLDGGWSGASRLPAAVEIVERMRQDGSTDLALDTLVVISLRCFWSNPDQLIRHEIIALAERLDVSPVDPRLVSVLAVVAPVERGAVALERLSELMGRFDIEASHRHLLGSAASAIGALGPAAVFLAAAVSVLREQGRLGLLAQALVNQAWAAAQVADTVLGMTAATEARGLAVETGQPSWALTADLVRGQVEALRGNGATARALVDQGERVLLSLGAHPMLAMVQIARGIDALAGGRHAEAYEQLSRIFDPSDVAYHPYVRFSALGHLAEAGTLGGRGDEVRARVRELEPIAVATGSPVLVVGLAYAGALLAPDGEAETLFRSGLKADLASWPFERARLQLAYGAWLRRQRRPADSRPLLRAAIAAFEALGTVPWAQRARRELRASGESLRRPDDARVDLTPQELQIAQLAAKGLSNREIAGRLFLSPRTVSTHLYRIYPKVGISSRTELAAVMARMYVM